MNQEQEESLAVVIAKPTLARPALRPLQMTLSLFPSAPGRPIAAAVTCSGASPRLLHSELAGATQRALPIRGLV